MTSNKRFLTLLSATLPFWWAGALTAQGFHDTFTAEAENINDLGYFMSGSFGDGAMSAVSDGALGIAYGQGSAGLVTLTRHFPSIATEVGDVVTLNFTMTASGIGGVQRMIRFSLGYVDEAVQRTEDSPLRSPIEPDGMIGYLGAISGGAGMSSIGFLATTGNVVHKEGLATNGNDAGALSWIEDSEVAVESSFTDVEAELRLERTADGWDVRVTFGEIVLETSHESTLAEINTFGFGMNGGQDFAVITFDEIRVALAGDDPLDPTKWAGFDILASGWVDTGDFLGLIFPAGDFVYVLNVGGWMFLPEEFVLAEGAWTYVFRD